MEDAYIQHPWLIVKELPVSEAVAKIKLFRYDLRTGSDRTEISEGHIPEPTESEMEALGGHLYFMTGSSKTHKCVIDLDITTLTTKSIYCGDTGWVVGDPRPSADGLVVSEVRPNETNRCKRLVIIPTGQKPRRDLAPPVKKCKQWSGHVIGSSTVWDEIDPTEDDVDMGEAALYARTDDGDVLALGDEYTESMITCGGWYYWRVQGRETLRRWQPGSNIEIIYRGIEDGTVLGRPFCGGDQLIFPEANTDPDSNEEIWYTAPIPN